MAVKMDLKQKWCAYYIKFDSNWTELQKKPFSMTINLSNAH